MLGLNAHPPAWRWQAVGKHPAAADYIRLLDDTPLTQALGDWVTKGYDQWQGGRTGAHPLCSWRFWVKGGQKEHLLCGVVRDSSDRIGRPFPLMVIGEGVIKGWERLWPRLPLLLDKTWARMERLSVHRFDDLKALGDDLRQLAAPSGEALETAATNAPALPVAEGEIWRVCQADLQASGRAMIPLEERDGLDPVMNAMRWHAGLQACRAEMPRAVFMGGSSLRTYLAVFLQPLSANDFVNLWSVA